MKKELTDFKKETLKDTYYLTAIGAWNIGAAYIA